MPAFQEALWSVQPPATLPVYYKQMVGTYTCCGANTIEIVVDGNSLIATAAQLPYPGQLWSVNLTSVDFDAYVSMPALAWSLLTHADASCAIFELGSKLSLAQRRSPGRARLLLNRQWTACFIVDFHGDSVHSLDRVKVNERICAFSLCLFRERSCLNERRVVDFRSLW
jgi:hypothetical protein